MLLRAWQWAAPGSRELRPEVRLPVSGLSEGPPGSEGEGVARMGLCHKELPDRLQSSSHRKAQAQETGRAFLQVSCPAGA